jgi:ligand-binding SRPBCC domain-containing protein
MLQEIRRTQFIKSDINTVWDFISAPANLSVITPGFMGFEFIGARVENEKMYQGQLIQYHVFPVAGIKMYWVTEITHVSDKEFFVDEQRIGPYAFWHHKHFIKEVGSGVEMTDIVHYKAPLGFLGRLANTLYIRNKLKTIFDYRYNKIEEIFNSGK